VSTIVIDGLSEEDFRRSIQNRLRENKARIVIERLRTLVAPYAGPDGILPKRFLTVGPDDLVLSGWAGLGEAVSRHDRPGRPVTAVSIAFGWPGDDDLPQPDSEGRLKPHLEVSYFTDDSFPFSQSGREDLLEGYSFYGCTWAGDAEATDTALWLDGIDDLHGALALLETRLLSSEQPDPDEIMAGTLGSCLLSTLLFQAVGNKIAQDGLPRALCVTSGSNGVYPYFDAPVVGMPEDVLQAGEAQDDLAGMDQGIPGPRYSSLLMTGIPRAKKRAVLVLDESENESANRIARLRGLPEDQHEAAQLHPEIHAPAPIPEQPYPAEVPQHDSPLLAKKGAHKSWDLRETLGSADDDSYLAGRLAADPEVDEWASSEPDLGEWAPVDPLAGLREPEDWAPTELAPEKRDPKEWAPPEPSSDMRDSDQWAKAEPSPEPRDPKEWAPPEPLSDVRGAGDWGQVEPQPAAPEPDDWFPVDPLQADPEPVEWSSAASAPPEPVPVDHLPDDGCAADPIVVEPGTVDWRKYDADPGDPPPVEADPLTEPDRQPEPVLTASHVETPVLPGFSMLEPELQQRLQNLLSGYVAPVSIAPVPAPVIPMDFVHHDKPVEQIAVEPEPVSTPEASAVAAVEQVAARGLKARLLIWFGSQNVRWIGKASSAAISLLLGRRRRKKRSPPTRKRRIQDR